MGIETKDNKGDDENTPTSAPVWAHREFQNLKRLEKAGVPCPRPQFVKKGVMVMEFVGENGKAAWKLRDYPFMNHLAVKQTYEQVVHNMKTMYKVCHLVHSDLSEKSILWWNNQCYFTDLAHALEAGSNNSHAFLFRNCRNVIEFFKKKGLEDTPTVHALFKEITSFDFPGVPVENF
jgi:serine/threonine-protein kinase RIO1